MTSITSTSEDFAHCDNPDIHSSSPEYARRFEGGVGRWMLSVQEKALLAALPSDSLTILDVGGGHGQTAIPLVNAHRDVTVLGSSSSCADLLQTQISAGMVSFKVGSLIELPFPDNSFDTVVCFRIMSHTTQWKKLVAEMCRVARSTVIVDYPVWASINILTPLSFPLKRKIERNTRTYKIFTTFQVAREFRRNGFSRKSTYKQFLLPMVLYRILKNPSLSGKIESILRRFGLTALFGSPAISSFARKVR